MIIPRGVPQGESQLEKVPPSWGAGEKRRHPYRVQLLKVNHGEKNRKKKKNKLVRFWKKGGKEKGKRNHYFGGENLFGRNTANGQEDWGNKDEEVVGNSKLKKNQAVRVVKKQNA